MNGTIGLVALALGAEVVAAASSWPQFRGARGDGVHAEGVPPLRWSETNGVIWKAAVPGRGRSSPVVAEGRVWLTTALEEGVRRTRIGPDDMQTAERVVLKAVCLEVEDGRVVWERTLFPVDHPDPVHWLNSWATPTPVVEGGRVYCDFGTFGTACLDAGTGQVKWQRRLPLDHQVGPGSSPVLWRDYLILVRDGRDAQYVTALDRMTGQEVWRTERPPIEAPSPNLKKSFVTPVLREGTGRPELISPGPHWTVSYDPGDGREHWRVRHGDGFSIGSGPALTEALAIFSTGCFKAQFVAVRLDGSGDVTASHVAWKSLRQVPVMSSPVVVGADLFYVSDDGMATCAEAASGQPHWQERLGGSHLASVLAGGGRVYFFAQDGRTTVVRAGREFEKLAENRVEGTVVATPAMVGDELFYRTDTHLYRISGE